MRTTALAYVDKGHQESQCHTCNCNGVDHINTAPVQIDTDAACKVCALESSRSYYVHGTGSTEESVSMVGLWQLLTPPVGVNRHCAKIYNNT